MNEIAITPSIAIKDTEVEYVYSRASGPGGQNVNKVTTAVQLRFDAAHSPSLPDDVRERILELAGQRVTADGILIIEARRHRTQEQNRADALDRFIHLVRRAAEPPRPRVKTRPTAASRRRRVEAKRQQGQKKRLRGKVSGDEKE